MSSRIVKILNNNAVLAEQDGKQLVVFSKGIGFSRKPGEPVDLDAIDADKRIFHMLDENETDYNRISRHFDELAQITQEIVEISKASLSIREEGLFDALFDHISFSIERLRVGIPIENPFVTEISILCRKEYPIAQAAAKLIRERLGVSIGDAEIGFIALHLYSARKKKPLGTAMKSVRVYKLALDTLSQEYLIDFNRNNSNVRAFLLGLSNAVYAAANNRPLQIPLHAQLTLQLDRSYKTAVRIATIVQSQLGVALNENYILFLALDIYKLVQLMEHPQEVRLSQQEVPIS